jgi:colanic acid biosynthesis protein WcaH
MLAGMETAGSSRNRLPDEEFAQLVRMTPLVSLDFIVRDGAGRVLLGRRNFEPAKGSYFVPGGRILKDEPIRDAFSRLLRHELGLDGVSIDAANFAGVYEHFHPSSRYGPDGSTTHYVVLAYALNVAPSSRITPDDQHSSLEWMREDEVLGMPEVHELTKAYFTDKERPEA